MIATKTPEAHGWRRDMEWQRASEALGGHMADHPHECWRRGLLGAIVSRDDVAHGGGDERWHISISHRDRVPDWEELSRAAHELRPGVTFVVGVPPRSWWINVHPNVLHLWETKDENLEGQWRFERRGDEPS